MENLTSRAAADVTRILLESRLRWGDTIARRTQERLYRRFRAILSGQEHGHRREDVHTNPRLRFVVEAPFVIAFDVETRQIARVLHGHRNIPRLFPPASGESS